MTPEQAKDWPEKARKLLDGVQPWPWKCEPCSYADDCVEVSNAEESWMFDSSDATGPLVAAAPELAELVASMRYEYLVREDVGYLRDHGAPFDTIEEARQYRDMKREDAPMVIVRRLVTNWEVVEHD